MFSGSKSDAATEKSLGPTIPGIPKPEFALLLLLFVPLSSTGISGKLLLLLLLLPLLLPPPNMPKSSPLAAPPPKGNEAC